MRSLCMLGVQNGHWSPQEPNVYNVSLQVQTMKQASSLCGVFNERNISKGFKNSHSGLNPSQNLSLYLAWKEKH